ncbi:TPA: YxeA family protein [Salmonella enterica subsp. enterica serovar Mississippi]|nr:YxeA family protein [Salmonella enterica subsp. enterica]ECW0788942.1 YxeA family protein [Salmonella enterica subsp. enterica]HED0168005.1 YxeA family protein [Salmonella enterica subsp. enterica serovar Mississippi]HED0173869.1 YxeA family protein [Salmonella enterica subsp. enterica serovar Mississippi]HED0195864.1 YxeA family protein [Salmonella enterica subsp. enterica serovar Mississippi]
MNKLGVIFFVVLVLYFFYMSGFSGFIVRQIELSGSDEYYVVIPDRVHADNWTEYERYSYVLTGYAVSGARNTLAFDSFKILRPGVYLRVYVRDGYHVISWEEVAPDDIPVGVRSRVFEDAHLHMPE